MEELQIKVHKALELRCKEIKQAPENRGERRARRLANPAQAARRAERGLDECERVGELYKTYNASDIIDLEKKTSRNIGFGSVRRILWDIFKENKLIIKKIELNHVVASLSEFASDDGGSADAAALPPSGFPPGMRRRRPGKKGGRRTRRKRKKRKKRKKRTRRK
jgi:hypothetical protein